MLFRSANYSYDISTTEAEDKATSISKAIGNWQQDLSECTNLITERFISSKTSAIDGSEDISKMISGDIHTVDAEDLPMVLVPSN